jgi:methylenetetrahydrofolate dehydrogenase (NADP+)/methenyltetrahydrofolate cyclohydrolase
MIKLLKGSDLVEYVSERQAKQIRGLIQSKEINPKLAIISANPENKAIQTYIKLKVKRAEELGITVDVFELDQNDVASKIKELTKDSSVHGIILQLPLKDPDQTEDLLSLIPPEKDVDGLTKNSLVQPATAQAVMWLLAGYNIELREKNILIIGKGQLVGAPLAKLLEEQQHTPISVDDSISTQELSLKVKNADIIISAAGVPSLITEEMLKNGQIVVDCGTSESNRKIMGDLDPKVYETKLNLKLTARVGGIGPLTISSLFENLLQLIDKATL